MATMIQLSAEEVRSAVSECAQEIIDELAADTDREELIERMDEECDTIWGNLVQQGMISDYGAADLVRCAGACATIIDVAEHDAWVEDDSGLWDGLTYGVVPSLAYFSLRNLLYSAMKSRGVDSNDDSPLAAIKIAETMTRNQIVSALTAASIECYDNEDTEVLREALRENIKDGTIDADDLAIDDE